MTTAVPIHRQASKIETEFSSGDNNYLEIGKTIWIPSTDSQSQTVWEHGTVMAIGEMKVTVRSNITSKILQIDRGFALPLNPRTSDDMTSLYYIHEPGVLYNLEERSKIGGTAEQQPYTFMANVLIAVNPLRKMEDPKLRDIMDTTVSTPPHPYAVAEMAYQQMAFNSSTEMPTNQSVVISGESGAGKTESSKIVLRHLTTRGVFGKKAKPADISAAAKTNLSDDQSLGNRLIEQNPILEAFGNAKTLRNHNSSRFGKFMKLQFSSDGNFKLAGAFVETYLLEKSRLVYQVNGERNFHIFYQLIRGITGAMKTEFGLSKPENYHYLNQTNCFIAENTDDEEAFKEVVKGLNCVGINEDGRHLVFSVLAGLLHLGNIEFAEEETPEGEAAIVAPSNEAQNALTNAANLLYIEKKFMLKVITEREISTKDETFTVRRNAQNSIYARDAIAKSLYGRLFDWIINCVNVSLGQDPAPLPYIGVLDIFGFESFQRNDFEQLLINFTNEVLQATFNKQVFIAEMELYKREGITVGKIDWPDNRECVELIAGKSDSILQILDNEAINPKPSDSKFLALLHRTHKTNPYFPKPHPKDMLEIFTVRHFAGCVSYTIGAFIDKNNDTIPRDMADLFLSSASKLVTSLFQNEAQENGTLVKGKPKASKLKSVAMKFTLQMNQLVNTLDATRCNFIRCVKPNSLMKMGIFDPRYVVGQLRCQGILQTAQVLKVGLPTRIRYDELVGAYKNSMPPDAQRLFAQQSDATLITAILWAFQVPMNIYKLGITRLFFKAGKISLLDAILKLNWAVDGPRIVKRMKLWLARRRWRVALAKLLGQFAMKKLLRRIQFRRNSVRMIQIWWRGFKVRRNFVKKRNSIIMVQSLIRGFLARKLYKVRKHELIAIAAARAEEARKIAEEAKRKEEEARKAAEESRREAEKELKLKEFAAAERKKMEMEAKKAEEEAVALAKAAEVAIREAELAAAAAAAAVENERLAELKAIRDAKELEEKIDRDRQEAKRRKEQALLEAAKVSATLLGGLAQAQVVGGASGNVTVVDITDDLKISQENREQLQQLNELLKSGAIAQSEYDELVPFLLQVEENVFSGVSAQQDDALKRLYSNSTYGVQIRCPACGASNNTGNGNNCDECGSNLTAIGDISEDTTSAGQGMNHSYYGYRARSMSMQDVHESISMNKPGNFKMDEGQRICIHGGYFQCSMHGTQILADENYAEYTVYVFRCGWQPETSQEPIFWFVSHRYSAFERLHKDLKHKIPSNIAILPDFPKKHVLSGVFAGKTGNSNDVVEERKKGLERYINQVLDLCARLPNTLSVPELERFLNLSREVEKIKKVHAKNRARSKLDEVDANLAKTSISGGNNGLSVTAGGAEAIAAREAARLPTELPTPFDEDELTQTEETVSMLRDAIRNSQGDLRRNGQVQHLLKICVQLQPRVHISANLENPFADMELIPRAMQCQEDLEHTIGLYNDSLLALTESYAISNAPPPTPYVPGQQDSYQRTYGRPSGGGNSSFENISHRRN